MLVVGEAVFGLLRLSSPLTSAILTSQVATDEIIKINHQDSPENWCLLWRCLPPYPWIFPVGTATTRQDDFLR